MWCVTSPQWRNVTFTQDFIKKFESLMIGKTQLVLNKNAHNSTELSAHYILFMSKEQRKPEIVFF